MQQHNTLYTIGFSAAVCIVCSLAVSATAVGLKSRIVANAILDRQKNVLTAAGIIEPADRPSREEIRTLFETRVQPAVVLLETGEYDDSVDSLQFDQQRAAKDPETSEPAPPNDAKVPRLPRHALVYKVMEGEELRKVVLPIEGMGLWSTLYGFIAIASDGQTIRGLTFYQHGETAGLGGEVDNPNWKALWPGRKIFGPDGEVRISVIKGNAGPPESAPYEVDGLAGATITSRGVTHLLHFWLGENGFGPYIDREFGSEGN